MPVPTPCTHGPCSKLQGEGSCKSNTMVAALRGLSRERWRTVAAHPTLRFGHPLQKKRGPTVAMKAPHDGPVVPGTRESENLIICLGFREYFFGPSSPRKPLVLRLPSLFLESHKGMYARSCVRVHTSPWAIDVHKPRPPNVQSNGFAGGLGQPICRRWTRATWGSFGCIFFPVFPPPKTLIPGPCRLSEASESFDPCFLPGTPEGLRP